MSSFGVAPGLGGERRRVVAERVENVPGSATRHAECPEEYERFEPF